MTDCEELNKKEITLEWQENQEKWYLQTSLPAILILALTTHFAYITWLFLAHCTYYLIFWRDLSLIDEIHACSRMLATSFVSGVVRPAAVSSRKSAFAGSSSSLNQANTLSVRAPDSRVVQVEGTLDEFSWVALFHECLTMATVHWSINGKMDFK